MKKLLVLSVVLGIASLASAGLVYTSELVNWYQEGMLLIGYGTETGTMDTYFSDDGYISPNGGDSTTWTGVYLDAGNASSIQDFGTVFSIHAQHVSAGEGDQVVGEKWFQFAISGPGTITVYSGPGVVEGSFSVVPEPATLALLGLGALVLRRKK